MRRNRPPSVTSSPSGRHCQTGEGGFSIRTMNTYCRLKIVVVVLAFLTGTNAASAASSRDSTWVSSWGAAQMLAEGDRSLPADLQHHVTIRQVVRLTLGGSKLRLHVSNAFGTEPLQISAISLARAAAPGSSRIDESSSQSVKFNDRTDVVIPAGAEMTSDALNIEAQPLSSVAVTMQIESVPVSQT